MSVDQQEIVPNCSCDTAEAMAIWQKLIPHKLGVAVSLLSLSNATIALVLCWTEWS
jgi:hypothetical protein